MRTDPRADWRHGFLIIYNALVEPRSAEEIAMNAPFSFWHRMKGVLAGSVR
jgi:hypothetical protein